MNGTVSPSLVTVKERVGRISSKLVPYLKILVGSEPVSVTVAVNLRSSMLITLVAGPDKEMLRLMTLVWTGKAGKDEAEGDQRSEYVVKSRSTWLTIHVVLLLLKYLFWSDHCPYLESTRTLKSSWQWNTCTKEIDNHLRERGESLGGPRLECWK